MRFFHLSDLHLGKHLHHYNLREDQRHILREVVQYGKKLHPDAIVIAGDVYDKSVPSAEAVSLFNDFLTALSDIKPTIPVLVISGNHDSGERLDFANAILDKHQVYISGKVPENQDDYLKKVTFTDQWGTVVFYLLPFMKPSYVRGILSEEEVQNYTTSVGGLLQREEVDISKRNVLVAHQFCTGDGQQPETCDSELIAVGGLDNVDVSVMKDFDYVALGHIHRGQTVGQNKIRYCGTLLKYSVSEVGHKKSLVQVTLREKGKEPEIECFPLHPLHDVRKAEGKLEDILEAGRSGNNQDYISVTLTDEEELYKPREQLDHVYPNLLELRLDNTRTRRQLEELDDAIEIKNPIEMFQDFYREVHGSPLSAGGVAAMEKLLAEASGGEAD